MTNTILEQIKERASVECETDEDFLQAETDRDILLAMIEAGEI